MNLTAATQQRPAVRHLLSDLHFRADINYCWLSREDAGRYALIVPAMYGPRDFLRLVTVATVEEAVAAGLIELGEPMPMPPYNYGGRYRWRTVQQGQMVSLTEHGMTVATGTAEWILTPENVYRLWDEDVIEVFCKPHFSLNDATGRIEVDGLTIREHTGRPKQVAYFGDRITRDADGGYTVHHAAAVAR